MCLTPDFTRTERMKKWRDKNPNAFVLRYKVLRANLRILKTYTENYTIPDREVEVVGLCSPYLYQYNWKVGFNIAKGTSTGWKILAGAIHTGSNKRQIIKRMCSLSNTNRVVVQVKCYLKDFIASDTENYEAWKQVYITKKEYDRAIKLAKKQIKEPV